MSELPEAGTQLYGGCYCSAVQYQIDIPALADRPILLPADQNKENKAVLPPIVSIDHCNDCRKAGGTILPSWLICPQSWVRWSVPISKDPFQVPTGFKEGRDIEGGPRAVMTTGDFIKRPPELDGFVTHYNSSQDTWRSFCTRCGTNLSYVCLTMSGADAIPMIDVVLGSLDRESLEQPGIRPDRHFYWNYGVDWVQQVVTEGDATIHGNPLPRHPESNRRNTV